MAALIGVLSRPCGPADRWSVFARQQAVGDPRTN